MISAPPTAARPPATTEISIVVAAARCCRPKRWPLLSDRGAPEGCRHSGQPYCGGFTGCSGVSDAKPSTKACTSVLGLAVLEQSTVPTE
jgi:hypothetical protein